MNFSTFQRYIDKGELPKKTGRSQDVEFTYTGHKFDRIYIEKALCGSSSAIMHGFTWANTPEPLARTWGPVCRGEASLNNHQREYLEFLLTLDM